MNYLVTGASGFLGRHLVEHLLSTGHSVNYTARKRAPTLDGRAAFYPWSTDQIPPLDCMGRLDAVIHLAGEPVAQRWNEQVKRRILTSRAEGTRNLVAAIGALRYRPSVLVSASGVGYYGSRGDEVLTETSSPGSGFLVDVCKQWEQQAEGAQAYGVRVVTTRIAIVLGDGGALPQMALPFRFGVGGKIGSGQQWMPWIHVRDLVQMLCWATLHEDVQGPVNAASPHPLRNSEFTREMGRVLHRATFVSVPGWALRIAMGELGQHMLDSVRVLPQKAEQHGFAFAFAQIRAALEDLFPSAN